MTPPAAAPLDGFLALAEKLADTAAPIVMKSFRRDVVAETKEDRSPVTVADRDAEAAMRALIEAAYPNHGILGEEMGEKNTGAEFVWVLDPIDGTQSFVTGKPLFGTLIALARDGVPVLGVMDAPALGERWVGCQGRVSTFNGEEVSVRPCAGLDQAWLYATSPQMFEGDFDAFERLRKRTHRTLYGAECIAYGLLTNGYLDLVCEATMKPYDYAALVPVVTGAGGIISDWSGAALTLESDGRVLAAGDADTHALALAVLNG
jgi:inositol-phosphate phosphatase/L-galactose 1-phosphate phosphatase/histidinol-phosphatase